MKISINETLINRNKKLSQIVLYISLGILAIGFLWTIRNTSPSSSLWGYLLLIPVYLLVQISIFMTNKWARSPRPDEVVVQSLKGLNDLHHLYIYTTPIPYFLVGPAGIWIINPYHHEGEITYHSEKGRFEQKGGGNFLTKFFAQDSLPNLMRDSINSKRLLERFFNSEKIKMGSEPQVVNIFYSENANVRAKNAPVPTIQAKKLKDTIRRFSKENILSQQEILTITEALPQETS